MVDFKPNNPSNISNDYMPLLHLGDRVKNMEGKEVETIITELFGIDRDLQFGRKVMYIGIRNQRRDTHDETSESKSQAYCKTTALLLTSFGVVCSVGGALSGYEAAKMVCPALERSLNTAADYCNKMTEAEVERFNHMYQRLSNLISEITQQIQEADRDHQKSGDGIERLSQSRQRLIEAGAGS